MAYKLGQHDNHTCVYMHCLHWFLKHAHGHYRAIEAFGIYWIRHISHDGKRLMTCHQRLRDARTELGMGNATLTVKTTLWFIVTITHVEKARKR